MLPISAITFILIFVAGCFAALFIDASYGIFLYIFEYFLNPPGRWWGVSLPDLRYAFLAGLITLIAYLIRSNRYSHNKIFDVPQTKWLIFLGILMIITWPVAVWKLEHEKFLIIFIKYILLYILIFKTIDTPQKFEKMMGFFLLGQFYLGWIAYVVGRGAEDRLESLGGADSRDANSAAALMTAAIPIIITYLVAGRKWQKVCSLIALTFIFNAIILVNSRGALIGIAVSLSYYFFFALKSRSFPKFNKVKVLSVGAAGMALFMYLVDPLFLNRMDTITMDEETTTGYTGRERIDFWMKTFDMVKDYPLGSGVMGYDYLSSQYLPPESLNPESNTRAVHSLYFQVLAEYGYHGLFIFLAFIYSNFRYSWKLRKSLADRGYNDAYFKSIAIEAGFLAVLVSGIFISIFYMEIIYWMSAFLASFGNIFSSEIGRIKTENLKTTGSVSA